MPKRKVFSDSENEEYEEYIPEPDFKKRKGKAPIIKFESCPPINSLEDLTEALKSDRKGLLIEGIYPNGARAYYGIGI